MQPMQQINNNTTVVVIGNQGPTVGPSFGMTSTPHPGWNCCNTPPCHCGCCSLPVYFSDNHKTWGETGEYRNKCCGLCGGWTVTGGKVGPGGTPYDYEYTAPGCCSDGLLTVSRGGGEIGRIIAYTYCCPCDKTMLNAFDTTGKSMWTLRSLPCSCCCCGGGEGCCGGQPCCSCWGRVDDMWLSPGEGKPREPYVMMSSMQWHRCCPQWHPWWYGYDAPVAQSEDERAILLGFLMIHGWIRYYRFQMPRFSVYPLTFGEMA